MSEKRYNAEDLVQGLSLSLRQLRIHIKAKKLVPSIRTGNSLLFTKEDIERFLELRRPMEDDCRYKILVWEPERIGK